MNLAESWRKGGRSVRHAGARYPVSVKFRPEVDALLQVALQDFPDVSQNRMVNDLVEEGLSRLGFKV